MPRPFLALPTYVPGRPVPDWIRELAAKADPTRTYVFLYIQPGDVDLVKRHLALVQVFRRVNGRWRYVLRYLSQGDMVGNEKYPTPLKIAEIHPTNDDILVTFVDADGKTQIRSGEEDLADPLRRFLAQMCQNGGPWEKELFPP